MKNSEIKAFIELLLKDERVKSFKITDWKECGEFNGDDPRPILEIEKIERNKTLKETHSELINKPVETTNEQPKVYCKAKIKANKPVDYKDCNCHNFCKFDNIQFDTNLG